MNKADAIKLVEQWLQATGNKVNEPDGVRVDQDNVSRDPEGWYVPWNDTRALDQGDPLLAIVPYPACIVTEPEGQLRFANTTPYPGFSTPLQWPGEQKYSEIIDPEYRAAGLYGLGVPPPKVAGWKITHPDGREEEKINPDYKPGPLRMGLPRHQNAFEALLNYHETGQLARDNFLIALLGIEVLVPLHQDSDELAEDARPLTQYQRGSLRVYSSPRHIPRALRWWRMTVPTFVARFPDIGMIINDDGFPSTSVTGAELAELIRTHAGERSHFGTTYAVYQPSEPVIEIEPGLDGSLDERARAVQQQFGLPEPPGFWKNKIVEARASRHELTLEEREKLIVGEAWIRHNTALTSFAPEGQSAAHDDISGQNWPADLHANGLMAGHDPAGRVRPTITHFGKYPHVGGSDVLASWHAVVGAYVGFALGDAFGSAVDAMSWDEIRQRYGNAGITDPQVAFERPGQVSWRTQLLLFVTEAAIRGMTPHHDRQIEPTALPSAHARWLVTQGLPWPQAAGPIAADHPEPDGWLVRVPDLYARRGASPQLIQTLQASVPDPSQDRGLHGPLMLAWALPGALAGNSNTIGNVDALAHGWHRTPLDVAASRALGNVFNRMFRRGTFIAPTWLQIVELLDNELANPANPETRQVADVAREAFNRCRTFFEPDRDQLEKIGTGDDTLSVFGRAVLAAARREYDPKMALRVAANQSGRSAMTAAITGALVGARAGVAGLPREWVEALDIGDLVQEVADHAYWHFARRNPHAEKEIDWAERYPRW